MKSKSNVQNCFRRAFVLILLTIFLFSCSTSPQPPQASTIEPAKTKTFPSSVPSPTAEPIKIETSPTPKIPNNELPPTKNFSIQDANKIAPDDVLQEVSFSVTGGGGFCNEAYSTPTIVDDVAPIPVRVEWLDSFMIVVCGWKKSENVTMTITFPDGTTHSESQNAIYLEGEGTAHTYYNFTSSAKDLTGKYTFLFEGKNGKLTHNVTVYIPSGPRLYPLYDMGAFYLYGYTANERVRFFLYNSRGSNIGKSITAWKDYYVNDNGQLIIKTTIESNGYYFAVGDTSGANRNSWINILTTDSSSSDALSCNANLSPRLQVGKYAYVATDPPLDQRVREGAGRDYSIIGYIDTGNPMKILDGPKCAGGWTWWKVQSIKKPDLIGWTSEGDDVYWLIPCDSLNSCP